MALLTANEDDLNVSGLKSSGFKYFIERVIENSRAVIADVMEKAYDRVNKKFALKALYTKEDLLTKFAKEVLQRIDLCVDGYPIMLFIFSAKLDHFSG